MNNLRINSLWLLLPLLVPLTLLQGTPETSLAQSPTASVDGQVLNGTENNAPVAEAAVTLTLLDGANKRLVATTTSDPAGRYHFGGLLPSDGVSYIASASNAGVTYTSQPLQLPQGQQRTADLTVYEVTPDPSAISVRRLSMVIVAADQKSGLITLVESYHVHNGFTAAYIGSVTSGVRQTIRFPLFQGARNLTPLDGFTIDDASALGTGFGLSSPVLPGDSVFSFTYDVPYGSHSVTLRRSLVDTTDLVELIQPGSYRVVSPQLPMQSRVQLGNRSFDAIQGADLPAGSPIVIDVSGLPSRSRPLVDLESLPVQLALMAITVSAIAMTVLYLRKRNTPTAVWRG